MRSAWGLVVIAACGHPNNNPGDATDARIDGPVDGLVDGPVIRDIQVATGLFHTCAIHHDGSLWCWGFNDEGQLGDGTSITRSRETRIGTSSDWAVIALGYKHSCALKANGTLWCWGLDMDSELGDGLTVSRSIPTQIGVDHDWAQITAGNRKTCALKSDRSLWCWGYLNDNTNVVIPTRIGTAPWKRVATAAHTCGIQVDGSLWCWGVNAIGQIGTTDPAFQASPLQVGSETDWDTVAVATEATCAIRGGALYCWGDLSGNGTGYTATATPTQIAPGTSFARVALGERRRYAQATDGTW